MLAARLPIILVAVAFEVFVTGSCSQYAASISSRTPSVPQRAERRTLGFAARSSRLTALSRGAWRSSRAAVCNRALRGLALGREQARAEPRGGLARGVSSVPPMSKHVLILGAGFGGLELATRL